MFLALVGLTFAKDRGVQNNVAKQLQFRRIPRIFLIAISIPNCQNSYVALVGLNKVKGTSVNTYARKHRFRKNSDF